MLLEKPHGTAHESKGSRRQTLEEWSVDLCRVKSCRDGFVSIEIQGYSRLFACPQCDRAYTDRPGYTSIPSIKRWSGRLELYDDDEMERRRVDRRDVIERLRSGKRGTPSTELDGVKAFVAKL